MDSKHVCQEQKCDREPGGEEEEDERRRRREKEEMAERETCN